MAGLVPAIPSCIPKLAGLLLAMLATVLATAIGWAATSCPASPPMPALHLPHLRAALVAGEQAIIVAFGSSSTKGTRASTPGRTYPAELQMLLSDALPNRHVAVINRGIAGQDAGRESTRLVTDVVAVRPQLVIWQVGANAALRKEDPERFRQLVGDGIQLLQHAGIDVVLMDNQRSPRILTSGDDVVFDQALAELSRTSGAGLFSRDRLMAAWEREGVALADFTAPDNLHHNDRGYLCVARALAEAILADVSPPGLSASR
jgi:lysophospholipase L1-like esterase